MKVIISETDRYEIDLPTGDIALEDFKTLVKKLNVVVNTFTTGITSAKQISQNKGGKRTERSRSDVIAILKEAFALGLNAPEIKLDEVLKKHNTTKIVYSQFRWRWIQKFQITPQELGLEKFPDFGGRPRSS